MPNQATPQDRRALITGATGTIGGAVAPTLAEAGVPASMTLVATSRQCRTSANTLSLSATE